MSEYRERIHAQAERIEALLGLPEETVMTYGDFGVILTPDQVDALLTTTEVDSASGEFPIARIANDMITQALGALSLAELKERVSRTGGPRATLPEHDHPMFLRGVTRRIYAP